MNRRCRLLLGAATAIAVITGPVVVNWVDLRVDPTVAEAKDHGGSHGAGDNGKGHGNNESKGKGKSAGDSGSSGDSDSQGPGDGNGKAKGNDGGQSGSSDSGDSNQSGTSPDQGSARGDSGGQSGDSGGDSDAGKRHGKAKGKSSEQSDTTSTPASSDQSTTSSETDTVADSGESASAVGDSTSTDAAVTTGAPATNTMPATNRDVVVPRFGSSPSYRSGLSAIGVTVAIRTVRIVGSPDGHAGTQPTNRTATTADLGSTTTSASMSRTLPMCAKASVASCTAVALLPSNPNAPVSAPQARSTVHKQLAKAVPGPAFKQDPPKADFYDEIYGLIDVQATQYTDDATTPILVVQGLVTNMSRSPRRVPPLLAIVWDKDGRELKRWQFMAELTTLVPGASTGFRSEAIGPDSDSAKVTVVLAPEVPQVQQASQ